VIDFRKFSQTDFQENSPRTYDRNFHVTLATLLHYLVKFGIQSIKFMQPVTLLFPPQILTNGISANVRQRRGEGVGEETSSVPSVPNLSLHDSSLLPYDI